MRKQVATRFGRTALTAGILSIGMLSWGIAQAASGPNTAPAGSPPPIVPATLAGMPPTAQVMWAVVNADGTKARSFPTTISTSNAGTGSYVVVTRQNVSACAFIVSLGDAGSFGVAGAGFADAQGSASNPDAVFVDTRNSAGTLANKPFHLAILC